MSTEAHGIADEIMKAAEACHLKILGRGTAFTIGTIAKAINDAVMAERARIVARLLEEAELTPCGEDAMVIRSNAFLIKADFSYEEADRLSEKDEA